MATQMLSTLVTYNIENETNVVRSSLLPAIAAFLDKTSVFFLPPPKVAFRTAQCVSRKMTRLGWTAEALSILVGRIRSFEEGIWMVLSLKPLRRPALGKGAEGETSEIRQIRDIGKRWEDTESTAKRCILFFIAVLLNTQSSSARVIMII